LPLRKWGFDTQGYGLSIQALNDTSCATVPGNCGDDTTGSLSEYAEMDAYAIYFQAGTLYRLRLKSSFSTGDFLIEVYDPYGNSVATQTANSSGLADLESFQPPVSGQYTVLIGFDTQGYGLSIQALNDISCTTTISCNQSINRSLTYLAEMDAYAFFAQTGSSINITATTSSSLLTGELLLYDMTSNIVATDLTINNTATINHIAQSTGNYLLIYSDVGGNNTGSYTINLSGACSFPQNCIDNINLDNAMINSGNYHAANTLNSSGQITDGAFVKYKAGNTVSLNPGFCINSGTQLFINIEDCASQSENDLLPHKDSRNR